MITKGQLVDTILGATIAVTSVLELRASTGFELINVVDIIFLAFGAWLMLRDTRNDVSVVYTIDAKKHIEEHKGSIK